MQNEILGQIYKKGFKVRKLLSYEANFFAKIKRRHQKRKIRC
jgi:hypothetical protein